MIFIPVLVLFCFSLSIRCGCWSRTLRVNSFSIFMEYDCLLFSFTLGKGMRPMGCRGNMEGKRFINNAEVIKNFILLVIRWTYDTRNYHARIVIRLCPGMMLSAQ